MERLQQLLEFLSGNPGDSFLQYALALEYIKRGEYDQACGYFEGLVKNDPDYVGTYYHLARLYKKLGEKTKAENCYQQGITVATRLNDVHALGELKNAYTNFQMGIDDDE